TTCSRGPKKPKRTKSKLLPLELSTTFPTQILSPHRTRTPQPRGRSRTRHTGPGTSNGGDGDEHLFRGRRPHRRTTGSGTRPVGTSSARKSTRLNSSHVS